MALVDGDVRRLGQVITQELVTRDGPDVGASLDGESLSGDGSLDIQARVQVRVAAEGRRFGLYLLVSTQRPQKVHENIVSQCDNLLLMRMNSVADVGHLTEVFSFVPPSLLQRATGFRQGEALIAGKVVPTPTFVRFGARVSEEGGSDVPADWARGGA